MANSQFPDDGEQEVDHLPVIVTDPRRTVQQSYLAQRSSQQELDKQ